MITATYWKKYYDGLEICNKGVGLMFLQVKTSAKVVKIYDDIGFTSFMGTTVVSFNVKIIFF